METHTLMCFFFFNDTATTEIYTLSLHDALPICGDLAQYESLGRHLDHRLFGNDKVDHLEPGEREGAPLEDLGVPVAGCVLHRDDHLPGACNEIHRSAHALDHLAGDHPVGEIAF